MAASLTVALDSHDLDLLGGGMVPRWLMKQAQEALDLAEPSDRVPDPPLPASPESTREFWR